MDRKYTTQYQKWRNGWPALLLSGPLSLRRDDRHHIKTRHTAAGMTWERCLAVHRRDIGKGGRYDSKHCINTARSSTRSAVLSPSEIILTWIRNYGHSSVKNARSLPRSISLWIPSLKFEPKVKKLSKKGGFQIESDNVDFDVFLGKTPRIVARAYHYFRVS